jgi:hypothetical protein
LPPAVLSVAPAAKPVAPEATPVAPEATPVAPEATGDREEFVWGPVFVALALGAIAIAFVLFTTLLR